MNNIKSYCLHKSKSSNKSVLFWLAAFVSLAGFCKLNQFYEFIIAHFPLSKIQGHSFSEYRQYSNKFFKTDLFAGLGLGWRFFLLTFLRGALLSRGAFLLFLFTFTLLYFGCFLGCTLFRRSIVFLRNVWILRVLFFLTFIFIIWFLLTFLFTFFILIRIITLFIWIFI